MPGVRLTMNNSKNATDIICEEALGIEFRMTGLLLMFFIITFGVLGNALVCISVIKYSFLRKLSNYFVFSLAVSDIFVSVCVIPFDVIYWIQFPLWTLGSYLCNLWNSLFFLFLTASIFNLLAISVDRFTAVVFPLKYPVFMTLNTTKGIVFTVWIYSSTVGVLLFNLLVPPSGQFYTFELDPNFHAFLLIGNVLCPFCVMVLLYLKIYTIARKHARKIADVSTNPTTSTLSTTISQELRIARTLGIVVCCFVICWLPFVIINVKILLDNGVESCDMEIVDTVVCWLAYLSCTLNPVLYALASSDFRRAFRGILYFWKSNDSGSFRHQLGTPSTQLTRQRRETQEENVNGPNPNNSST